MSNNKDPKSPRGRENQRYSTPGYPILDGHIRKKKKLVPPILAFPQTTFVSSIDLIFPEIIWIGLLLDLHGLRDGIEIVSDALKDLWNTHLQVNWYRFSEIAAHPDDVCSVLGVDRLYILKPAFAALKITYDWPGLDWANSSDDSSDAEHSVGTAVRKYCDRFEQPYLTILATIIYSMGISGKVKFATGTVPDIEAVASDWGSDRARSAASSLRAFSMAFFPNDGSEASEHWCKHFWRRNYEMSSCELNDDQL